MVSRVERAKQFLPFDALKGLQEALREREKQLEYVERVELSDEEIEKLSEKLQMIEISSWVRVKYYCNKMYKEICGNVKVVDSLKKKLIIVVRNESFKQILMSEDNLKSKIESRLCNIKEQGEVEIRFCDILNIEET